MTPNSNNRRGNKIGTNANNSGKHLRDYEKKVKAAQKASQPKPGKK